jgi:hypothetical protein
MRQIPLSLMTGNSRWNLKFKVHLIMRTWYSSHSLSFISVISEGSIKHAEKFTLNLAVLKPKTFVARDHTLSDTNYMQKFYD